MPLNVAVLGTGMSARVFHVPFILALPAQFTLHTILSSNPASAKERFPHAQKYVDKLDDVLADSDVHVICICTPNATHFPYTKAALEAGKHVILEKPLCASSAECDELIALAQAKGRLIAPFQNRRFDSDFRTLQRVLAGGELGTLAELETRYDRFRPALKGGTWKEAGGPGQGVLYDLGSHLIDQVLTLFGPPARIWAHIANSRKLGPEDFHDSFIAHFFYEPDAAAGRELPLVVNFSAGVLSLVEPQLRFTAKGTKGSFIKYGLDAQEAQLNLAPPLPLSAPNFGVEDESIHGVLTTAHGKATVQSERGNYLDWYKGVAAGLAGNDGKLLPVKAEEARDVIRVIELCYDSAQLGQVVPWVKKA
ncbi:putative NAD binding Rossmann fold oxidoreductase [Auricularia subglabra TFB-10046 SS5]|nr:putative NAD binding Rossmann fold oxidoreductase [Auricularia subglabra TFB-10046 SS5]